MSQCKKYSSFQPSWKLQKCCYNCQTATEMNSIDKCKNKIHPCLGLQHSWNHLYLQLYPAVCNFNTPAGSLIMLQTGGLYFTTGSFPQKYSQFGVPSMSRERCSSKPVSNLQLVMAHPCIAYTIFLFPPQLHLEHFVDPS